MDGFVFSRFLVVTQSVFSLPFPAADEEEETSDDVEDDHTPGETKRESVFDGGFLWMTTRQVLPLVRH